MRKLYFPAAGLSLVCAMAASNAMGAVVICNSGGANVLADNSGATPASSAIQKCVNDPGIAAINLPPGTYLIDAPIKIAHSGVTIRTAGLAANTQNCQQLGNAACATFLASSAHDACINNNKGCHDGGMIQADSVTNVIIDHLILDGNRAGRLDSIAFQACTGTQGVPKTNRYGFNSHMNCSGTTGAQRCEFTYNFTRNALCGTGLEFKGVAGRIQGNAAFNNGAHFPGQYADGLTVLSNDSGSDPSQHSIISDNHAVNNSDVGLIIGSAANGFIRSNWIQQTGAYAFAGLMIGNFCEGKMCENGNYSGASIDHNTIQCNGGQCGFGINFGPDPWIPTTKEDPHVMLSGATITANAVSGARVLVNFGGADGVSFIGNTLSSPATTPDPGVADGSICKYAPGVFMNLHNNNRIKPPTLACGNNVNTDVTSIASACFKACFP